MNKTLFLILLLNSFITFSVNAKFNFSDKNTKAIYGVDDRKFVDSESLQKIREISKSVAMIVERKNIKENEHTTKVFGDSLLEHSLCSEEKFAKHLSAGVCTGFLIGPDLLVSAGHCFLDISDCQNQVVVFNVLVKNEVEDGVIVSNENVYECREIVSQFYDSDNIVDFAIIRLNRKVREAKALKMRTSGKLSLSDKVFMIGHPLGLPLVATRNAKILNNSNSHFFNAELDSFSGNSGSPIFNSKTFKVEGILVRGEEDFVQNPLLQCYHSKVYNLESQESTDFENMSQGESVIRMSDILPFIKR